MGKDISTVVEEPQISSPSQSGLAWESAFLRHVRLAGASMDKEVCWLFFF